MRRRDLIVFGLMLALGLSVYWPIFQIRPLGGDNLYVLGWVDAAGLGGVLRGDAAIYPEWRPLSYLSVWLEYHWFGLAHVSMYFLTNLIGWTACGWVIYRIVCELTGRPIAAFVAALIPLFDRRAHQALTWIIERQTIFASLFGLLALLIVIRSRRREPSRREHVATTALLIAAMLSKEHGAAFTIALALYGWWAGRRDYQRIAAISLGVCLALRFAIAGGASGTYCEDMGFMFGVQRQCLDPGTLAGLPQMLYNVAASFSASLIAGLFDPAGVIAPTPYRIAISVIVLVLAWYGWRKRPPILLLPALLPLGLGLTSFMIYRSRNVLIGIEGVAIVAGLGLARLDRLSRLTRRQWIPAVCVAIVLLALGRRAFDAFDFVKGTSAQLNLDEPCASDVRERWFGTSFVPAVKRAYELPDPDCASPN